MDELNEQFISMERHKAFIEYEQNLTEQRVKSFANTYKAKVSDYLRLELEGIEEVCKGLRDVDRERILRRVRRIRSFLDKQ